MYMYTTPWLHTPTHKTSQLHSCSRFLSLVEEMGRPVIISIQFFFHRPRPSPEEKNIGWHNIILDRCKETWYYYTRGTSIRMHKLLHEPCMQECSCASTICTLTDFLQPLDRYMPHKYLVTWTWKFTRVARK